MYNNSPPKFERALCSYTNVGEGRAWIIVMFHQSAGRQKALHDTVPRYWTEGLHPSERQSGSDRVIILELYRPNDRRLSAKLVPNFENRGCRVVSVMDPYGSILRFLDWCRYFFFQVAPQLYSRVNPLLLRKSGSSWNRTQTFGSVARNSDH
jgi:hypothetical protein